MNPQDSFANSREWTMAMREAMKLWTSHQSAVEPVGDMVERGTSQGNECYHMRGFLALQSYYFYELNYLQ